MNDDTATLNARLAVRIHELRSTAGLSLGALAAQSGVSRSTISLIERAETSPTAVVLEKLATALGLPLAALFDRPEAPTGEPVARAAAQPVWRDPESGYLRRNVSPSGGISPIRIVEVECPPGARIAYETGTRVPRVHQQVWVLEGRIDVTLGDTRHRLETGDCLAMELDRPTMFRNPTRRPARYAVVLVGEPIGLPPDGGRR